MNITRKTKPEPQNASAASPLNSAVKRLRSGIDADAVDNFYKEFKYCIDNNVWVPLLFYNEDGYRVFIVEENGKYYASMLSDMSENIKNPHTKIVVTDVNKLLDRVFSNEDIDGIAIDPYTNSMFIEKHLLVKIACDEAYLLTALKDALDTKDLSKLSCLLADDVVFESIEYDDGLFEDKDLEGKEQVLDELQAIADQMDIVCTAQLSKVIQVDKDDTYSPYYDEWKKCIAFDFGNGETNQPVCFIETNSQGKIAYIVITSDERYHTHIAPVFKGINPFENLKDAEDVSELLILHAASKGIIEYTSMKTLDRRFAIKDEINRIAIQLAEVSQYYFRYREHRGIGPENAIATIFCYVVKRVYEDLSKTSISEDTPSYSSVRDNSRLDFGFIYDEVIGLSADHVFFADSKNADRYETLVRTLNVVGAIANYYALAIWEEDTAGFGGYKDYHRQDNPQDEKNALYRASMYLTDERDIARFYRKLGYIAMGEENYDCAAACFKYSLKFENHHLAHHQLKGVDWKTFNKKYYWWETKEILEKNGIPIFETNR